jgi:hypothetical protein
MSEQTTRRRFFHMMGAIAAAPAVAVAAQIPAAAVEPDPVFAAIAAMQAEEKAINESAADVSGTHYIELCEAVWSTVPTTFPGLLAFVQLWREDAEYFDEPPTEAFASIEAALRRLAGKEGLADA